MKILKCQNAKQSLFLVTLLITSFLLAPPYKCDTCGRSYKYPHTLRSHKKFECGKAPQFACTVEGCTYKSKIKGNLKKHLIRHLPPSALNY